MRKLEQFGGSDDVLRVENPVSRQNRIDGGVFGVGVAFGLAIGIVLLVYVTPNQPATDPLTQYCHGVAEGGAMTLLTLSSVPADEWATALPASNIADSASRCETVFGDPERAALIPMKGPLP